MRSTTFIREPRWAVVLILGASLLWGSAFPAIKRAYHLMGVDPSRGVSDVLVFAGVRFLVAGVVLLAGVAIFRLGVVPPRRVLARLLVLGLVQTTLQYTTFYLGMVFTTGVKASIIVASGSFFMAALSPLFFRDDRLTRWKVVGLLLGFTGVVLANLTRATPGDAGVEWVGDGLILATGLCSAIASLLSKRLVGEVHPVVVNGWQVALGAVALLAIGLPRAEAPAVTPGLEVALLTLYLAGVTAIAFTLYYLVLAHHDLTRVAAYRFLIPLSGVALSAALVPGERLDAALLAAAGLVGLGIWTVHRPVRIRASRA